MDPVDLRGRLAYALLVALLVEALIVLAVLATLTAVRLMEGWTYHCGPIIERFA